MTRAPLQGLRVIDLTDESAGLAGRLLADLGADVILAEPPAGARTRRLAPFLADVEGEDRSCVHHYLNANKRSVVCETDDDVGALLDRADVVLHVDAAFDDRFGVRPGVVVVGVTPFGIDDPRRGWKATDLVSGAAGGLLWVCGERRDPPTHGAASVSHTMAGLAAATAVLLALRARDQDPAADLRVDISLQEATQMCIMQTATPSLWRWFERVPHRPGLSGATRCADGGYVGLLVRPDSFDAFLRWLGDVGVPHTMTGDDWELARNLTPLPDHPVGAAIIGLASRLTRDEFVAGALRANVICLPVLDLEELGRHEQFVVNDQFAEVDGLSFVRSPVDTGTPVTIRRAPRLGEHGGPGRPDRDGPAPAVPVRDPAVPVDPSRILAGLRVVDFGWVLAAPIGTRILASFGADVIRVESSRKPDSMRSQAGPDGRPHPDLGGLFNDVNAGKTSLTVDVTTEAGRQIVARLVAASDVVVNNFRPGALHRMGFGFDQLRAWRDDIVLLNLPGAHRHGPWSVRPSMGNILMAASGFNSLMGFPGRPPRGVGIAYPDFTSPYLLVTTILAALRQRRPGFAQELHLAQLSAMVGLLGVQWMHVRSVGAQPPRPGNRDPNHTPHGVFPCAGEDEWCAIAVCNDEEFASLCREMARPALARDPRFATASDRRANEDELEALIAAWTRTQDRWAVAEQCQAAGVRAAAVATLADLMDRDPSAGRHYQEVAHPAAPGVAIPLNRECIRFRGARHDLRRAPVLGEHNEKIVRDLLGYPEAEYLDLVVGDILV